MAKYEYKVLRWFGMKPAELERQLNVLGTEGWAIIYCNEAVLILGKQSEGQSQHSGRIPTMTVLTPAMN